VVNTLSMKQGVWWALVAQGARWVIAMSWLMG